MTIFSIKSLIQEVRVYAAMNDKDFGWNQISQMSDEHISEIILDNNCATVLETISTMQNVATAFNEDD